MGNIPQLLKLIYQIQSHITQFQKKSSNLT
jgi:hypothetical protein